MSHCHTDRNFNKPQITMKKQKNPNTLQAIATTPLQSNLLTTHGLPVSTADMRWNRKTTMNGEMILEPFNPSEPPIRYEGQPAAMPSDYIPAWSLGKLVNIYGGVLNVNSAAQLRAYLVDMIGQMMVNGGGILHSLNLGNK